VDNPPYPDDEPILKKLEAIDVVPGQDFDADNLDPKHADALIERHELSSTCSRRLPMS
jgi:hypothetical protein